MTTNFEQCNNVITYELSIRVTPVKIIRQPITLHGTGKGRREAHHWLLIKVMSVREGHK